MSRATEEEPHGDRFGDGDCVVCDDPADGIDAGRPGNPPVCRQCATIRCDGGRFEKPAAARAYEGQRTHNAAYVHTVDDEKYAVDHVQVRDHHLRCVNFADDEGEDVREVIDFPHHRVKAVQRYPLHDDLDDDVDRGDGPVTDGGRDLYGCDTPTCDGEKEVITPDGYVCRDCADALAVQYEEVERGDGVATDGGLLTGGSVYHVVCSDCTFEKVISERHHAARAVDVHRRAKPSHDTRFEEVSGR